MAVLAIDPGAATAGALILACRPEPILFELHEPTAIQIYRAVRWAKDEAAEHGEKLELFAEDQYLERGGKANPRSMILIARSAERWLFAAELLGCRTAPEQASVWREPMIKTVDPAAGSKKKRTKIFAVRIWPELEIRRGEPATTEGEREPTAKMKSDPIDAAVMARWRIGLAVRQAPLKRRPK